MPLKKLARQIAKINHRGLTTPVLVTPSYLKLQPPFFVALTEALAVQHACQIHFDLHCEIHGSTQILSHALARHRAARIERQCLHLAGRLGTEVTVQVTASIGRPTTGTATCLVGVSSDPLELPNWTTAIRLTTTLSQRQGASPRTSFHLQSPELAGAA